MSFKVVIMLSLVGDYLPGMDKVHDIRSRSSEYRDASEDYIVFLIVDKKEDGYQGYKFEYERSDRNVLILLQTLIQVLQSQRVEPDGDSDDKEQ